jgi:hypothetical protein
MSLSPTTYERPPHGWTCFHCGETFTTEGSARVHFGAEPSATPGCVLKVRLGAERGLLMALRDAEERIARYVGEDSDTMRELHRMQSRHTAQLLEAEEAGYARGMRDAGQAMGAQQRSIRAAIHEAEGTR